MPQNPARPVPALSTRGMVLELCAILCLGIVPLTVYAFAPRQPTTFVWDMWLLLVLAMQIAVPLLYVMWRSGSSWLHFGITRLRPFVDPLVGVLIVPAAYLTFILTMMLLGPPAADAAATEPAPLFQVPSRAIHYPLLALAMIANAASEELLVRGYLVTRLRDLSLSPSLAVVVSSTLWALYHMYQGTFAATAIFLMGLLLGGLFVLLGRIWPLIVAHALYSFLAYLSLGGGSSA